MLPSMKEKQENLSKFNYYNLAEAVCKILKIKGKKVVPLMYAIILDYRYNPLIMNFLELPVFYCIVAAKKSNPTLQYFEKKELQQIKH